MKAYDSVLPLFMTSYGSLKRSDEDVRLASNNVMVSHLRDHELVRVLDEAMVYLEGKDKNVSHVSLLDGSEIMLETVKLFAEKVAVRPTRSLKQQEERLGILLRYERMFRGSSMTLSREIYKSIENTHEGDVLLREHISDNTSVFHSLVNEAAWQRGGAGFTNIVTKEVFIPICERFRDGASLPGDAASLVPLTAIAINHAERDVSIAKLIMPHAETVLKKRLLYTSRIGSFLQLLKDAEPDKFFERFPDMFDALCGLNAGAVSDVERREYQKQAENAIYFAVKHFKDNELQGFHSRFLEAIGQSYLYMDFVRFPEDDVFSWFDGNLQNMHQFAEWFSVEGNHINYHMSDAFITVVMSDIYSDDSMLGAQSSMRENRSYKSMMERIFEYRDISDELPYDYREALAHTDYEQARAEMLSRFA